MDPNSQRLKDALDALGASLATGNAAIPVIQARIANATVGTVPASEVSALADEAAAFQASFNTFVAGVIALEGTSTGTAPQP